ncbi:MAG: choice-of-anchor B family protein [Candidatus Krumholzibacteriia bacterium]
MRIYRAILLVVSVAAAVPPGGARAGGGTVALLGQLALPNPRFITDVWGYVDGVTGREYALVGTRIGQEGFYIIDVTNPGVPTFTSQANFSIGFDIKVWDHYAYTVTGAGGGGGRVVDIANVLLPSVAGSFDSSHNIFIDDQGFLYESAAGLPQELRIYDLNPSPASPTGPVWNDGLWSAHDVSVVDSILYDFHGVNGTRIYDVRNPAAPVFLGGITDPNIAFHHSGYPTGDHRHLLICDELATDPAPDVTVWNIEDLTNPFKVAEIRDSTATVHNVYIVGNFAYFSHYTSGFKVYDISDPTQPLLADEFDTSALSGEGFLGAFGVYPFAPSANIYVSDMDNGLYVFSFTPDITAVTFAAFDAEYENGRVHLSWAIASADGLEGYHVYRSREPGDGYRRLNPGLVPAAAGHTYEDTTAEPGVTYWYRLGAVDRDGEFLSPERRITVPLRALSLRQNVPNPFNPSTAITYDLPAAGRVRLAVYDPLGRHVRTLVDGVRPAGVATATWNGTDDNGRPAASGVYFCRLTVDGQSRTRQMLLLK